VNLAIGKDWQQATGDDNGDDNDRETASGFLLLRIDALPPSLYLFIFSEILLVESENFPSAQFFCNAVAHQALRD